MPPKLAPPRMPPKIRKFESGAEKRKKKTKIVELIESQTGALDKFIVKETQIPIDDSHVDVIPVDVIPVDAIHVDVILVDAILVDNVDAMPIPIDDIHVDAIPISMMMLMLKILMIMKMIIKMLIMLMTFTLV